MCLLMFQRVEDENLTKEIFDKAWSFNPDGFGLGYLHKTKNILVTRKNLKKSAAWEIYKETRDAKKYHGWLILHWRFKTHGLVNEDNCHPFRAGNNVLLGHNGHIKIPEDRTYPVAWSDTRYFASILMDELPDKTKHVSHDKLNAPFVQEWIGNSKLVTLEKGNEVKDAKLIYWGFPVQKEELKKYGMFSNYGWEAGTRAKVISRHNNFTPPNTFSSESLDNRYMGLRVNRDIAPELPSVWWIVNELLDDPAQSYINMIENFIRQWGRSPTSIEIECAHDSIMDIYEIDSDKCDVREEPVDDEKLATTEE